MKETTVHSPIAGGAAAAAGQIDPAPVSVISFGSFARGDDEPDSDIDVVIVRQPSVDANDDLWLNQIENWRATLGRIAGRHVETLDVDAEDAAAKLASRRSLWREIRRDGHVVFGHSLSELPGHVSV
jgi:predicted nucleotidyltransferase